MDWNRAGSSKGSSSSQGSSNDEGSNEPTSSTRSHSGNRSRQHLEGIEETSGSYVADMLTDYARQVGFFERVFLDEDTSEVQQTEKPPAVMPEQRSEQKIARKMTTENVEQPTVAAQLLQPELTVKEAVVDDEANGCRLSNIVGVDRAEKKCVMPASEATGSSVQPSDNQIYSMLEYVHSQWPLERIINTEIALTGVKGGVMKPAVAALCKVIQAKGVLQQAHLDFLQEMDRAIQKPDVTPTEAANVNRCNQCQCSNLQRNGADITGKVVHQAKLAMSEIDLTLSQDEPRNTVNQVATAGNSTTRLDKTESDNGANFKETSFGQQKETEPMEVESAVAETSNGGKKIAQPTSSASVPKASSENAVQPIEKATLENKNSVIDPKMSAEVIQDEPLNTVNHVASAGNSSTTLDVLESDNSANFKKTSSGQQKDAEPMEIESSVAETSNGEKMIAEPTFSGSVPEASNKNTNQPIKNLPSPMETDSSVAKKANAQEMITQPSSSASVPETSNETTVKRIKNAAQPMASDSSAAEKQQQSTMPAEKLISQPLSSASVPEASSKRTTLKTGSSVIGSQVNAVSIQEDPQATINHGASANNVGSVHDVRESESGTDVRNQKKTSPELQNETRPKVMESPVADTSVGDTMTAQRSSSAGLPEASSKAPLKPTTTTTSKFQSPKIDLKMSGEVSQDELQNTINQVASAGNSRTKLDMMESDSGANQEETSLGQQKEAEPMELDSAVAETPNGEKVVAQPSSSAAAPKAPGMTTVKPTPTTLKTGSFVVDSEMNGNRRNEDPQATVNHGASTGKLRKKHGIRGSGKGVVNQEQTSSKPENEAQPMESDPPFAETSNGETLIAQPATSTRAVTAVRRTGKLQKRSTMEETSVQPIKKATLETKNPEIDPQTVATTSSEEPQMVLNQVTSAEKINRPGTIEPRENGMISGTSVSTTTDQQSSSRWHIPKPCAHCIAAKPIYEACSKSIPSTSDSHVSTAFRRISTCTSDNLDHCKRLHSMALKEIPSTSTRTNNLVDIAGNPNMDVRTALLQNIKAPERRAPGRKRRNAPARPNVAAQMATQQADVPAALAEVKIEPIEEERRVVEAQQRELTPREFDQDEPNPVQAVFVRSLEDIKVEEGHYLDGTFNPRPIAAPNADSGDLRNIEINVPVELPNVLEEAVVGEDAEDNEEPIVARRVLRPRASKNTERKKSEEPEDIKEAADTEEENDAEIEDTDTEEEEEVPAPMKGIGLWHCNICEQDTLDACFQCPLLCDRWFHYECGGFKNEQECIDNPQAFLCKDCQKTDTWFGCKICNRWSTDVCVQCTGSCKDWFHYGCVNLRDEKHLNQHERANGPFKCGRCNKRPAKPGNVFVARSTRRSKLLKKQPEKRKYNCPTCKKSSNSGSIKCVYCNEWYHMRCAGLLVRDAPRVWDCKKCKTDMTSEERRAETERLRQDPNFLMWPYVTASDTPTTKKTPKSQKQKKTGAIPGIAAKKLAESSSRRRLLNRQ